ncbi:hypothetical protein MHU86_10349 [Fragilaria crotonensis]|nr:hypothetical protein MHU86_10349 [Fragilaria crotonensis]
MTCSKKLFYAKQRLLKSVILLDSDSAGWRFREDPAIGNGLCVPEASSDTPTAALPSMSIDCRPGSFDRNDPRPMCAEFELLLRLIRPHHPPWTKAMNHSAALERLGLINSIKSVASAVHPPLQEIVSSR